MVARGERATAEWLTALKELRPGAEGYGAAVLREEDLLRVLENASAPENARAGAAIVLRRVPAARARVRVAPPPSRPLRLRVVLDRAVEDDDPGLGEAVEALISSTKSR